MLQSMLRFSLKACVPLLLFCCLLHAQTPTITSISPNPVGIGQSVTITGTNFGSSGSVTFSGIAATTTLWNSTSIIATVPAGTTNGNVIVTSGGQSSSGFPFTLNNGPVTYVYDPLGRLVGVIDVYGNAAEYSYDAVGNINSISRFTPTQVSIIEFSPQSGPVTTSVTISGTGFSATPSQNTVKFHGVTATVTSATTTQLKVKVPSTATTGAISVTSPNGTATSTAPFTVTASNGVPTIGSFSPANGVSGTAVTLTGTNFNTTLANNELQLNASRAAVSSVTGTTTMATSVPASTASGRFTLLTPSGNATSLDFYVPFGTHVPTDIGFTTRISSGTTQPVTLASQIALLLFDGSAGQTVNVSVSGSTYSTCTLYLIAPNNAVSSSFNCAGPDSLNAVLNYSGTYTIGIDPGSSSGTVNVLFSSDFIGQLTLPAPGRSGTAVSVPTSGSLLVGQSGILLFDAVAGQRVSINLSNSTIGSTYTSCETKLYDQTRANQITWGWCGTGNPGYIDTVTLPTTETYSVDIVPSGTSTGSVSVSLNNDADVTSPTITVGGSSVTPSTTVAGQDVRLSFTPTASQPRIAVLATSVTNPAATLNLWNGTATQATIPIGSTPPSGTFFIDTQSVNANQQYQVWVQHAGTNDGKETLRIYNVPADLAHTSTIGSTYKFTTTPGQNANVAFTLTSSESITVSWTNGTYPTTLNCYVRVTGPSPSTNQIGFASCNAATGTISLGTISSGTYNILVDPQAESAGGLWLKVATP